MFHLGMITIAIISQKGGAGKTTLTLHLAVEAAGKSNKPVAILDIDPQASAMGWGDSREADNPVVIHCPRTRIAQTLQTAKENGAVATFIDTAPHAQIDALDAARAADLVLIPTRPGILDLRAIGASIDIAALAKVPAVVVINAGPPRGAQSHDAAEAVAAQYGAEVCPIIIPQRAVYSHAITESKTAQEYEKESKAAQEMVDLWNWIVRRVDTSTR